MSIVLNNISKSYGGRQVLENLSFEIPDSGIFGIFGGSGCGKTTLIRIICGLEKADGGSVSGAGKFSVVFQEDRLMPTMTALENVTAVSDLETANKCLEKVGLTDSFGKYPSELSGGMSRRVAVARALAFDAQALILDEPFKGLEAELKEKIGSIICEYAKTKPVILVTHDEYGMSLADDSVTLERQ